MLFQGASQSMPWLAELVQSSEGSLDVLPVQCLCEFLLLEKTGENSKEQDEGPSKEMQDKRVVSSQRNMFVFRRFTGTHNCSTKHLQPDIWGLLHENNRHFKKATSDESSCGWDRKTLHESRCF